MNISSPRRQLGLYFLLLLGGIMLAVIITVICAVVVEGKGGGHSGAGSSLAASTGLLKLLQGISTVTIFLIPAWLFASYVFRDRPFHHLGFNPVSKNSFYILAVALMLLAFPLVAWLGQLNRGIPLPAWMISREQEADRQIADFLKTGSLAGVLLNVFVIALLPAVCEEASFRGGLQPILIRMFKNPWAGIIVTAMIFSAFHFQFQGFLPRMLLGMLLGAIYWYSGSLWVSITAHFFANAVQVIAISYYPKYATEDPTVPVYAALISMAIVAGLLLVMSSLSSKGYSGDHPKDYDQEFQ